MAWKYHDPENDRYLEELKASSGFADKYALEKLVLDFEMHYRLKSEFKMVVRGGMAAILHERAKLQRISEDIDVLTPVPKPQVLSTIDRLNTGSGELKINIEGEPTRIPEHLVHCRITCPSSLHQKKCTAIMDILCGADPNFLKYAETLHSPCIETLKIEHAIDILSRGALIADKMCTLTSSENIGLRNLKNFPKQIFDIAMLLTKATHADLRVFFTAHAQLAPIILRIRGEACSVQDMVASSHVRCVGLLDSDEDALLSPEYRRFYDRFQRRYVKNRKVHTMAHHTDEILLAILCARHLAECSAGGDPGAHAKSMHAAIRAHVRAGEELQPLVPAPDPDALARIGRAHPNLAGHGALLTPAQWALLLEAFAPPPA